MTFIKGRALHESVLALHEIAREIICKTIAGLMLNLDFEKSHDRVNWEFLIEMLTWKGFSACVVHRLMQLVSGGHTKININGETGTYFRNAQGVR
jgi:hypothetical protein